MGEVWDYLKDLDAPYISLGANFTITCTQGHGIGAKRFVSIADGAYRYHESLEELDEEKMSCAYKFHDAGPMQGGSRFVVDVVSETSCVVVWTGHPAPDHSEGEEGIREMERSHGLFLHGLLLKVKEVLTGS